MIDISPSLDRPTLFNLLQITKELRADANVQIIKGSQKAMDIIKTHRTQTAIDLSLYTKIQDQLGSVFVEIRNRDNELIQSVEQMGTSKLLRIINQLNQRQQSQSLIAWDSDLETILMRSFLPKSANLMNRISMQLYKIWDNFLQILESLLPKKEKQIWGQKHEQMRKNLGEEIQLWKKKINERKNNQLKSRNNKGYNCSQSFFNIEKQYSKKQYADILKESKKKCQQLPYILHLIKIVTKTSLQDQYQNRGHFCDITFYKCKYKVMYDKSINRQTDELLDLTTPNAQKQPYKQSILAAKMPLIWDTLPFEVQKKVIKYLRQSKCQNIANYYFSWNGREIEQDIIFMPKYNSTLQENNWKQQPIKMAAGITMGVEFLFSSMLAHRDMKPSNIMINDDRIPKVIDFGSVTETGPKNCLDLPQQRYVRTTRRYNLVWESLPREVRSLIQEKEYSTHSLFDIFALGKILNLIFNNFSAKSKLGLFLSEYCKFLICQCTQINPYQRLYPLEVLAFLRSLQQYEQKSLIAF